MVIGNPENGMQIDYDDGKESAVEGGLGMTVYMVFDSSPAAGES
jgi:hypothetical protein